ncbi:MAG TPA: hypothetical protein VKI17_14250 [Gemmataceae bacterium]|nr:hypothetical protein [Gemmataceae bacterium]
MPAKSFDPTFKALVESCPADWTTFAGQPSAPTEVIDADIATVSGAADKVLCVRATAPYLLHLEFVSGHDAARLPRTLQLRNLLLEDRHDLPVRTVVVLLRPEADSPALSGVRTRGVEGEEAYAWFRYQVIRVWQLPVERLLAGGVGTLPLAPISAVTEAELPGIIKRMEERLEQRSHRGRAESLWAATYILMGLRYSRELARQLLHGVRSMKESVTYQAILEEGMAKGMAQGQSTGALAEARKLLLLQGSKRFGPPDAPTTASVESIGDLAYLEKLLLQIMSAASWQDLLKRAGRQRRSRRPRSS